MISIIVLVILALSAQAEIAAFDTATIAGRMRKAAIVPDFVAHAALNYFQPLKDHIENETNSTAAATAAATTTATTNTTSPTNTEDVHDYSFWGGFLASLAMICFAEFGDRVSFPRVTF